MSGGADEIRVCLLGPVTLSVRRQAVHLTALERALIATLALVRGDVVATNQLIDMLWPGSPPGWARTRVQALVSSIRRGLGPAATCLVTRAPGYLLDLTPEQVDVAEFERLCVYARADLAAGRQAHAAAGLRAALDLWLGDPLGGVHSRDAEAQATRLRELRLRAFADWAELELDGENVDGLVPELSAMVAAAPAVERIRAQLVRALGRSGRQAEAMAAYRDAHAFWRAELGIEPGPLLHAAQREVLADSPVAVATPSQLPPEHEHLLGRDAELATLVSALRRRGDRVRPTVVALSGMGGVGKTALALSAGHAVRADHKDGCLYADLRGHATGAADSTEILGSFLGALGCLPPAIPDDPAARTGLYRSLTADRALLIVLDNAMDPAQVRPLIPPSGQASVLVTSNQPLLTIDGAQCFGIEPLGSRDSVRLLGLLAGSRRIEAEPEAAVTIAKLCGFHPLALRIAGVRLAARPTMAVHDLLERLADERGRLDGLTMADVGVRSSFAVSYRRLSPPAARLLRALGSATVSDIPYWLPRVLAGGSAAELLDELLDAQLLEMPSGPPGLGARYLLHELVRLYATERGIAEDSEASREAALSEVYHVLANAAAVAADRLPAQGCYYWPDLTDSDHGGTEVLGDADPFAWFDAEWWLLRKATVDCASRGWVALTWRLAVALTGFAERSGRHDAGLDLLARAERVLANTASTGGIAEAAVLFSQARLRSDNSVAEPVRAALRRARLLFRKAGAAECELSAAVCAGVLARRAGVMRLAIASFHYVLAHRAVPSDVRGAAHHGLGNVYIDHGEPVEAIARYQQALPAIRAGGDRHGEANTLGCLGMAWHRLGEHERASEAYQHAAAIFETLHYQVDLAIVRQAEAELHAESGAIDRAEHLCALALATFDTYANAFGEALTRRTLGALRMAHGHLDDAIEQLRRSGSLFGEIGQPIGQARSLALLAEAFREAGDGAAAAEAARLAGGLAANPQRFRSGTHKDR